MALLNPRPGLKLEFVDAGDLLCSFNWISLLLYWLVASSLEEWVGDLEDVIARRFNSSTVYLFSSALLARKFTVIGGT